MHALRMRMGLGMIAGVALSLGAAAPAWAGHPAVGIAERIEEMTDDLYEGISDDFTRSPDYCRLIAAARQLERIGDRLEDAVDDEAGPATFALLASLEAELHCLSDSISAQRNCWVRPHSVHRALHLTREIHAAARDLEHVLTCHAPRGRQRPWSGVVAPRYFHTGADWPDRGIMRRGTFIDRR